MNIFGMDNPIMRGLGRLADLMWLNVLTLFCCIPVVTAGASLTAMHYVALKLVRNEECYIAKDFFKSFWGNFRQATLIWLGILLCGTVIAWDCYIVFTNRQELPKVLVIIIIMASLLVLCACGFVFPMLAKFVNSIGGTIKNAFLISIAQLPKSILILGMNVIPIVLISLFYQIIPIVFLFGLSLPAYGEALLYNKSFRRMENQILKDVQEESIDIIS